MKFRHAGALSLVGWYLMLPPLQFVGPQGSKHGTIFVGDAVF